MFVLFALTGIIIFHSCMSPYFVQQSQQNPEKKESTEIIPRAVYLSDSLNTTPEGRIYFNKGLEYVKLENYGEALPYFTKAINTNSNLACGYFFRGLSKIALKQIDEGCIDLNRAGELGIIFAYEIMTKIRNKENFWHFMKYGTW